MNIRYDETTHFTCAVVGGADDGNSNAVRLSGAATGVAPVIDAAGDNTNIGLRLAPKGTAQVHSNVRIIVKTTVTTDATAGARTYTIAELLGGLILRDPAGASRSDVTPTAALIKAAIPGIAVGDSFDFVIRNTADAAETITLTGGTNVTVSGTATIAQNNTKTFKLVASDVGGTPTFDCYSIGTYVH